MNDNLSTTGEKENYRTFYLNSDIKMARLGLTILLFSIIAFISTDYTLYGLSSPFYLLSLLRVGMFAYTLFMIFFLSTITRYGRYDKSVTIWEVAIGFFSVIVALTRPATLVANQIFIAVLFIFIICLVIPNRLLYQAISTLILVIGILGMAILNFEMAILTALIGLMFTSALSIAVSWQILAYRKQSYQEIENRQKTEKALRASEERFRSLVESTSDWIWQVDQNLVYTYSSPKVKDILGYGPEEVLGKTPFDFMPKEEAKKITRVLGEIMKKKTSFSGLENWNVHKNGNLVLLETNGVPLLNNKGLLVGYRGIDRDITERRKAEDELKQSEERFSKIFHSNPAAIVISRYDDGRIIDVNKTVLRLSGYTYEEVIGHTSNELKLFQKPTDRKQMSKLILEQGAINNRAMTFRVKNGELKETLFSTEKIKIGNEDCIISTVLDLTERRKLEKELEKYTKNLENMVKERTEKLKDAERLAAIGATAGMVGHDIRNPLQVILGDLYLIDSDMASLPEVEEKESVKESLSSIRKSAEYIDKIVQDLQDFAKPLKPNVQETDIEKICQEVLLASSFPENVDVKYVVEDEARNIVADPAFLKRILMNLVSNAVQAMPEGGKLEISAHRNGDEIIIEVQDSGVGIPEEVKPNLFTPLFTTKAKGQGFGLPVVKRMTEALGGTVNIESEEGKGTRFMISLPMK